MSRADDVQSLPRWDRVVLPLALQLGEWFSSGQLGCAAQESLNRWVHAGYAEQRWAEEPHPRTRRPYREWRLTELGRQIAATVHV